MNIISIMKYRVGNRQLTVGWASTSPDPEANREIVEYAGITLKAVPRQSRSSRPNPADVVDRSRPIPRGSERNTVSNLTAELRTLLTRYERLEANSLNRSLMQSEISRFLDARGLPRDSVRLSGSGGEILVDVNFTAERGIPSVNMNGIWPVSPF